MLVGMQIPPPTRFAERDGGSLAYQAFGDGDLDFVMITDPPTHLDLLWTNSSYVDLLLGFANGRRVITFDRRGVGLSDSFDEPSTLEAQALDLEAVLDAAGAERPAIFGYGGSAAIAAYFAATRPERVDRLILLAPWDRDWSSGGGGWSDAERNAALAKLDDALEHWGEGLMLKLLAPALDSARNRRFFAMLERASVGRRLVRSTLKAAVETDISAVLPSVRAPALVISHRGDPIPTAVVSRVAEGIPDSNLIEIDYDGDPRAMADYWGPVLEETDAWLTGARSSQGHHTIFATLLFTDIVDSTTHASRLGDQRWRAALVRHEDALREIIDREAGRLIKMVGDGSLSTFDGPVQAIRCATLLGDSTAGWGMQIRAGVHVGECERVGLDVAGMAVNVAARIASQAEAGEVLVTRPAMDLCTGSGLAFDPRGPKELKGVPGGWDLFAAGGLPEESGTGKDSRALRAGDRAFLAAAHRAPGVLRAVDRMTRSRR